MVFILHVHQLIALGSKHDVQIEFHKPTFLMLTAYVSTGQEVKLTCVSAGRAITKTEEHPFKPTGQFNPMKNVVLQSIIQFQCRLA